MSLLFTLTPSVLPGLQSISVVFGDVKEDIQPPRGSFFFFFFFNVCFFHHSSLVTCHLAGGSLHRHNIKPRRVFGIINNPHRGVWRTDTWKRGRKRSPFAMFHFYITSLLQIFCRTAANFCSIFLQSDFDFFARRPICLCCCLVCLLSPSLSVCLSVGRGQGQDAAAPESGCRLQGAQRQRPLECRTGQEDWAGILARS